MTEQLNWTELIENLLLQIFARLFLSHDSVPTQMPCLERPAPSWLPSQYPHITSFHLFCFLVYYLASLSRIIISQSRTLGLGHCPSWYLDYGDAP